MLPLEIQIRTRDMHLQAEFGIAAHWRYKEGVRSCSSSVPEMVEWVRRVVTVDTQNWHKSRFAGQSGRTGQTGRINQSDRSGQICQLDFLIA